MGRVGGIGVDVRLIQFRDWFGTQPDQGLLHEDRKDLTENIEISEVTAQLIMQLHHRIHTAGPVHWPKQINTAVNPFRGQFFRRQMAVMGGLRGAL